MAAPPVPDSFSRTQYSSNNPIDLTLDDDDDDESEGQYNSLRYAKRPRMADPPSQSSSCIPTMAAMSSTMSPFTTLPPIYKPFHNSAPQPMSPLQESPFTRFSNFVPPQPAQASYRPAFAGPPQFTAYRNQPPIPPSPPARSPPYQIPSQPSQPLSQPYPNSFQTQDRQVIDLTGSPSPPPQTPQSRTGSQPPLPPELPPKTPVCIGSLTVTALVLYPVPYLMPQNAADPEWAYVRLQYEHRADKVTGKETIHIKTPSGRGENGESVSGDVFGVVEQKVADYLGPMLGKGLIRLDAKIRKGGGNVSCCFVH